MFFSEQSQKCRKGIEKDEIWCIICESEKSDKVRLLNGVNTGGYAHPLYSQGCPDLVSFIFFYKKRNRPEYTIFGWIYCLMYCGRANMIYLQILSHDTKRNDIETDEVGYKK